MTYGQNAFMMGGRMTTATANAMETAAGNTAGAMTGFMGMNMAGGAMGGGFNQAQQFYNMGMQQQQQQMAQQQAQQLIDAHAKAMANAAPADGWKCSCGAPATGKFCPECGAKKPEPQAAGGWKCKCGATAPGKFCPECGSPKPADDGSWTCSCGQKNPGKFCSNCGGRRPAGVPQYRCDKCGWQPADPTKAPRFCPECGDPFDNGDII